MSRTDNSRKNVWRDTSSSRLLDSRILKTSSQITFTNSKLVRMSLNRRGMSDGRLNVKLSLWHLELILWNGFSSGGTRLVRQPQDCARHGRQDGVPQTWGQVRIVRVPTQGRVPQRISAKRIGRHCSISIHCHCSTVSCKEYLSPTLFPVK